METNNNKYLIKAAEIASAIAGAQHLVQHTIPALGKKVARGASAAVHKTGEAMKAVDMPTFSKGPARVAAVLRRASGTKNVGGQKYVPKPKEKVEGWKLSSATKAAIGIAGVAAAAGATKAVLSKKKKNQTKKADMVKVAAIISSFKQFAQPTKLAFGGGRAITAKQIAQSSFHKPTQTLKATSGFEKKLPKPPKQKSFKEGYKP